MKMAKREAMAADPAPEKCCMKTAGEWKKQLGTKEHIFTGTCVRAGIRKDTQITQKEYEEAVSSFLSGTGGRHVK